MFMRTKFFVAAAALCLTAFTACSDNEVLKPEVGGDNTYLFNEEGKGYIRLSLDVPVETRAISTNDDGDLNEYKVNNIYLLIFSGADEAKAKFTSAYDLTSNFTKNGQAEITSTAEIIKEINKEGVGSADNLYAYVMLNKPASLTFSSNSITLGAVTSYSNGSFKAPASTEGMTFSAFKTLVINNQADEIELWTNRFKEWYETTDKISEGIRGKFIKMKSDIVRAIKNIFRGKHNSMQQDTHDWGADER